MRAGIIYVCEVDTHVAQIWNYGAGSDSQAWGTCQSYVNQTAIEYCQAEPNAEFFTTRYYLWRYEPRGYRFLGRDGVDWRCVDGNPQYY